jgi:shikimate dehydrogenase
VRAAVLGKPVAHSLSPVLHRAAYAALGLDDWSYEAIECAEADLPGFLDSCGPDWAGLSLTMPLKRAVIPLLDVVDPLVTSVGGANTVVFRDGRRHGYNTDVAGIAATLAEAGIGKPADVTILGAGATACSALAALAELGVARADVVVRDRGRAADLLAAAQRLGIAVTVTAEVPAEPALLISTLPSGAADPLASAVIATAVLDVVYAPWPTPLARAALDRGATVASGLDMLLYQAAAQVELMTGRPGPVEAMRAAVRQTG